MATEKLIHLRGLEHLHCARKGGIDGEAKTTSRSQVVESLARCSQVSGLHLAGREKSDRGVASGVSCIQAAEMVGDDSASHVPETECIFIKKVIPWESPGITLSPIILLEAWPVPFIMVPGAPNSLQNLFLT